MRIAVARGPRFAMTVEGRAKRISAQGRTVPHERRPVAGPAEIHDRAARQTEGKVEAAEPRAVALQPGFETRPVVVFLDAIEHECAGAQATRGDGDGFARTWP